MFNRTTSILYVNFQKLRSFDFAATGLSLVFLLAGLTKFTNPELWAGYEPEFIRQLSTISTETINSLAAVLEISIGLSVISGWKRTLSSALAALWLLAITIQVTSLGLYDLAIRDLGLLFLALSVLKNSMESI